MLDALIVDDEKLVRKGLISTMPWDKYEIRIVGEAGNGRAALDFMREHDVDLLFADLTMPTMSGFELMKAVRMQHPRTWIVVLTCHQDFEYIQESMRVGAIDYIVKTQMDKESMDDILARIVQRIRFDQANQAAGAGAFVPRTAGKRTSLLVLIPSNKESEQASALLKAAFPSAAPFGDRIWSVAYTDDETELSLRRFAEQTNDFVLIHVHGEPDVPGARIWNYLFYEFEPNRSVYDIPNAPDKASDKQPLDGARELEERWFSFRWLYEEEQWHLLLASIERTKPDCRYLTEIFRLSIRLWRELLRGGEPSPYHCNPESLLFWREYKQALYEVRNALQERMKGLAYFDEIVATILRALHYMLQLDDLRVSRDLVAAKFNMSSGYFSECFKEIIGESFGDYMRNLQIEKAKRLLVETLYPIYQVAERTGYKDEKYFSKVFRERVGMNPTEYRKVNERMNNRNEA